MSASSARQSSLAGAFAVAISVMGGMAAPLSPSNAASTTNPANGSPPRGIIHDVIDAADSDRPRQKAGPELPAGIVAGSVGTLNGAIVVGDAGNVGWSTELAVVPGVGDIEPALRVAYGGSGYGALGVGFSMETGSSVARCREVLGRDGHHAPIGWNADDRLCLDGVRLEVVSGNYGAAQAEYRLSTGLQNVRVLGLGNALDTHSGFEVHTPDGRVTRYGAIPDQPWTHETIQWAQTGHGKVPFAWHITQVLDRRSANEMVYRYVGEPTEGEGFLTPADHRIASIGYGINATAGTGTSRRVLFDYADVKAVLAGEGHDTLPHETTPWLHQGYVSGQAYRRSQLLTRVRMEFVDEDDHWTESRQYRLGYEGVPGLAPVPLSWDQESMPPETKFVDDESSPDRVRLRALQECAPRPNDNQMGTHACLWPTLFEWSGLSEQYLPMTGFGWDGTPFYPLPPADEAETAPYFRVGAQVMADIDGDGKVDMLVMPEPMNANADPGTTWDYWRTDAEAHDKITTNIPAWSNQPWTNRAGTIVPAHGSVRHHYGADEKRPPEPVRTGQFKDEKSTSIAYALNYDGTGGDDVVIGEPVVELAGATIDPPWGLGSATIATMDDKPCPLFDLQKPYEFWPCMDKEREKIRSRADYEGHPGFMRDLVVVSLEQAPTAANPTAQFKRTSLGYRDGRPILWVSPPLDMDGDGLDELMFCKANADYAAAAGEPIPMFYGPGDTPVNWITGTMHYALNVPGKGIDLRDGGTPATDGSAANRPVPCHAKDTYLVLDLDGDGTQSLLHRLHPHAGATHIEQIAQMAPAGTVKDPFPKDATFGKDELTAYWHKVWEKVYAERALGESYYSAFTLRPDLGMRHEATTLPFEQFMVWQQSGNTGRRYSTHQASAASDVDGGVAMEDIFAGQRDGRWTDWGTPDAPMGGGQSNVRIGDVNGDGLQDVLMVDMQHCHWGQLGATESDPPVFKERACSFQDAMEFGHELIEQTYEKLAVFTYLNRGDGSFELADEGTRLWDTDLEPVERDLLEGIYKGQPGLEAHLAFNAAWTKATLATRSWRMEFGHSFMGDANGDGLADLGYIRTALEANGGWLGDTMAGRYRLYPVWRLGRHGAGLAHVETRMGLDLHDIVPLAKNKGWPGFGDDDTNRVFWGDADTSVATVDMYEQQGYGLAGRLLPIDVDADGRPELAFYDHVRGAYRLATPKKADEPQPHLLTAVVNGFESRTEVDYAPQWTLTHPDSAFTAADIHLPYPLHRRPSAAPAAAVLREDTGRDFGDGPAYRYTNYLYGKTLLDIRRGITLGMDRSYQQQSVATPSGTMYRRRMVRYSNDASYSEAFKAYPLAGSLQSETVKIWGSDDDAIRISHSGQRHSAQPGKVAPTWRRQLEASTASTYEVGQDVPANGADLLFDCLVDAYDGPAECALGDQHSYLPLSHSTTSLSYDTDYGVLKTQIVETAGTTAVTEMQLEHRDPASLSTPVPYVLGLPTTTWTAHEPYPGDGYVLRTSLTAYDALGRVSSTTLEPDRPQYRFTTSYTYDDFGHVSTSTVSADGMPDSTTTQEYGASGAYPTTTTNALGHTTTTRWYEGCGIPEQVTNPLGHTQVDDIDTFCRNKGGQLFHGDVPLSRPTQVFHIETFLPTLGREMKTFTFIGDDYQGENIRSLSILNRVGQVIESRAPAFGFDTYSLTRYDDLGRASEVSLPTKMGEEPSGWTTTLYDGQGRVVGVNKPDGTQQTTHYRRNADNPQLYETIVTDELGNSGTSVLNALGQVVKVIPPADPELPHVDLSMCYAYGAFGTLVEATPCVNNTVKDATTLVYDDYGRLTSSHDNQAGLRLTRYDALGRVEESEDALGHVTRMQYDVLGRLVGRTQAHGTPDAKTAVWAYDDLAPGVLTHAINADGSVVEQPLLDEYNRPIGMVTTIHGRSYTRRQSFDAWGRVTSQSLPSLSFLAPVTTFHQYNDLDQPIALSYQGQTLWEPVVADVWGLTEQRYGAGTLVSRASHHPLTGRLQETQTARQVVVNGQAEQLPIEHFTYDWYDHGLLRQRTEKSLTQQTNDQSEQFHYSPRGELRGWSTIGANNTVKHGLMA